MSESKRVRKRLISTGSSFEEAVGYSRAVVLDDSMVYVSGTTGFDYSSMTISDDIVEQTEQCWRNIEGVLREAGATIEDIVRVTYILPDASEFEKTWPVLRRVLATSRPTSTMLVAGLADPRMKIEIEVVACLGCGEGGEGEEI